MDSNEYQKSAARTLIEEPDDVYTDLEIMLVWNAIGLAGEAGEVADHIKKGVFHNHGVEKEKLIKELGDVLWYVAAIATKIEVSLSDVMARNIEKLRLRYPDGYSAEASAERVDTKLADKAFADDLLRMMEPDNMPREGS